MAGQVGNIPQFGGLGAGNATGKPITTEERMNKWNEGRTERAMKRRMSRMTGLFNGPEDQMQTQKRGRTQAQGDGGAEVQSSPGQERKMPNTTYFDDQG